MSDSPDRPARSSREQQRHRDRQLLAAAAVVVTVLLLAGTAALLWPTDDPASDSRAADAAPASSSAPTPTTPATEPTAAPPEPAPTDAVPGLTEVSGDAVWFRTPSDNIGCQMTVTSATCDLLERSWEPPPRPADCELDYGQGVFVDGDRSGMTCAGDTQFVPDAPVLQYGSGWVLGSVRCTSAQDGVTCVNMATRRGFTVSRDRYELL
jgi:hypothetical protein